MVANVACCADCFCPIVMLAPYSSVRARFIRLLFRHSACPFCYGMYGVDRWCCDPLRANHCSSVPIDSRPLSLRRSLNFLPVSVCSSLSCVSTQEASSALLGRGPTSESPLYLSSKAFCRLDPPLVCRKGPIISFIVHQLELGSCELVKVLIAVVHHLALLAGCNWVLVAT